MAVSGSSDFNLITNEIIELAYKSINALRDGGSLTGDQYSTCLLYTSPSPRDGLLSRMPSSA